MLSFFFFSVTWLLWVFHFLISKGVSIQQKKPRGFSLVFCISKNILAVPDNSKISKKYGLHNFSLFKRPSWNPSSQININDLYQQTNSGNTLQPRLTLHVLLFSTGCCVWSSCVTFGTFSTGKVSFSSARREMPFANQLSGFFYFWTARCWDS